MRATPNKTKLKALKNLLLLGTLLLFGKKLANSWFMPMFRPVIYSSRVKAPKNIVIAARILEMLSTPGLIGLFRR
jgi:hypothetical protein